MNIEEDMAIIEKYRSVLLEMMKDLSMRASFKRKITWTTNFGEITIEV